MPAYRTRDTSSRSLEVTTDAPHPSLAIISPTPRAFTFSNAIHSPSSSPSCSPFEPERSLALSCTTTTPPPSLPTLIRTLSPSQSIRSASPSNSHRRRKSSCSSDVERRPKKGDEDYIKRPENAFILFRRKCCEDRQQAQEEAASGVDGPTRKQRQADLSKTISQQWKGLTADERQHWEELAKEKKKEHEQLYPNYVYRPQRAKDKDGRSKVRKSKGRRGEFEHETDSESVSFVLPMAAAHLYSHRHHGRSASAPTPPLPYQSIQLPNVYMPSCPTSPSLMPMINRRTSHPGHQFDFCPSNSLMPPSFGQAGQYEASLQSDYYQGMFMPTHPQQMLPTLQIGGSMHHSGASSPVSPNDGPFTPTANMLAHSFSRLSSDDEYAASCADHEQQLQYQQELEFQAFSWENNTIWPSGTEMLLGDDFDLNAIPPIELGLPKIGEDMSAQVADAEYEHEFGQVLDESQFYQERQHIDGLYNFEETMAGHGF